MTTRQFDPVLSAALRNELEALADRAEAPAARRVLQRPQVWITAVTALVLVLATVGVLRLTGGEGTPPAGGGSGLVDPLVAKGGPLADETLRSTPVDVLVQTRGTGTTSFDVVAPAGSTRLAAYVTCMPATRGSITTKGSDGAGSRTDGRCGIDQAMFLTLEGEGQIARSQTIEVRVPGGTRFAIVVLAVAPSSTTTLGTLQVTRTPADLTDPLPDLLDPSNDAFIRQDPQVLLQSRGAGSGMWTLTVPSDVTSIRPYVRCATEGTYDLGLDGETGSVTAGCEPASTPSLPDIPVERGTHTLALRLPSDSAFALLVIATPVYAPSTAGPAQQPLPYPTNLASDQILARDRGDAGITTGRIPGSMKGVSVSITCEGDGSVTVATPFGTLGNPAERSSCSATSPVQTGGGIGGQDSVRNPEYTITPYGDVRWTVTFMQQSD